MRFLIVDVMWLSRDSSSFGVQGVLVFLFFFLAHFPREVPHSFLVHLELRERVCLVGVSCLFVVVYLFCESPPESGLPVLVEKVV